MAEPLVDGGARDAAGGDGLAALVDLARRRARLIAGCAALAVAGAGAYTLLQAPVYRATAELLVSPTALQIVGRDIVRTDSSATLDFANVDSQSLVMLSTPVLREVARSLGLQDDPAYEPRPGLIARLLGGAPRPGAEETMAGIVEVLKAAVLVHRVEGSLVFQITASAPRASRAAEIANAVADTYLRTTARERIESVKRADGSIIAQVAGLRDQLDAADAAAEKFRSANGLTKSSENGLVVTQQLKDLYTQIDAAGAEVSRLAARKAQVAKIGPEALIADVVPDALSSPTLTTLRSQYAALARDAASQSRTLLPGHPRMVELRAELAEAQRQLRAELSRIRATVADSYAQAAGNLANLQDRARALTRTKADSSEAETKLRQLESEAGAVRAVFDASLNRARELEQQGKLETSNSRVLSDAVPPSRSVKPPLPVVLAAAALFGACLGLGIGFLLDRVPRRVRPARLGGRDASRLLGGAVAVALPRAGGAAGEAAALAPLAAALRARLRGRLPAVVSVVSLRGASGGQAAASALAQALADCGEEVLLCEGDSSGAPAARRVAARPGAGRPAPREAAEFVVAAVDFERARASALPADAAVLAADLSRLGAVDLAAAARRADPSGEGFVGFVDLGAGVWPALSRRFRAEAAA